MIETLVR